VLSQEALFFSKAAMITFGGAYAVLWYINRQAVEVFGWLEPGQMVTGLGLAETTPGPLILVTQFVGFLGAYQHPGGLDPLLAGTLGAIVTTWATFAPCFLWIFLGAPFIEKLRGHRGLNAALGAITAAVVGVILNLAVVLGLPTLFQQVRAMKIAGLTFPVPVVSSIHVVALVLCVVAFVGLRRWKWGVVQVVLGCALVSLILRWAGLLPETAP
jgi:chromate transporter